MPVVAVGLQYPLIVVLKGLNGHMTRTQVLFERSHSDKNYRLDLNRFRPPEKYDHLACKSVIRGSW